MNYFFDYIVNNFILLCIVVILGVTLIKKLKTHTKISVYLLIILFITLSITILEALQIYVQYDLGSAIGASIIASTLYTLRPICILCFIFLSGQKYKGVWFYILLIPLAVNLVTVLFPYFPATKTLAFYYRYSAKDGNIQWEPGDINLLRFVPHIVCVIYLVFLLYKSIGLLQKKHFADALSLFVCAAIVSLASVIETFFNESGQITLLPTAIGVATVFYYLFLYERSNKIDILTGLFNRASYFDDFPKIKKDISGIIQLDMNGLKYLNDNFGHLEGDKGLKRIGKAISNNITKKMYAYRLGGDEFIVLAINESEEKIMKFISDFKNELKETNYYCSIGYAYKNKEINSTEKMYELSEEKMYSDKAEFYKNANIERRKSTYINKE